jgi:archaemetzincin
LTEIELASLAGPKGPPPPDVLEAMRQTLEDVFAARVSISAQPVKLPEGSLDPARAQYSAPVILKALLERRDRSGEKLLGITGEDLFIPMLSFVYGQAQLGGRAGLVSLARLSQGFYGLPENAVLLAARARKEAVHEAGHLFGLVHCEQPDCAMRLSTNIRQLDLKGDALCSGCASLAMEHKP